MVARLARLHPPMECVRLHDPKTGLDGVIAIHSTALGPGAGGCRLWSYADRDAALADAVRLAEGMSYKMPSPACLWAVPKQCYGGLRAISTVPRCFRR